LNPQNIITGQWLNSHSVVMAVATVVAYVSQWTWVVAIIVSGLEPFLMCSIHSMTYFLSLRI